MLSDPLPRLLEELQQAEAARHRTTRDSPAYQHAVDRVERLVRAIWEAAGRDPTRLEEVARPS